MTILQIIVSVMKILYLIALLGIAAFGYHCLINIILYLKKKDRPMDTVPLGEITEWPSVTIQLPIYNERYTVERLIGAMASLDYPPSRLQIQILDDSTDDTRALVECVLDQYHDSGIDFELIHRDDRTGFKAGALQNGMKTAAGEFVAVFDADFVPGHDWLKKALAGFCDPKIGCLQTRWGHLNRNANLLTRATALGIDSHFMIEQIARSRNGLYMNFNGTAGIWRKTCIEDAGGWQPDTLTEDMDLSYRAQMRGWKISYLPEIVVPGELPVQVEAFKRQQFRWAKGNFQVIRKLIPRLFRSKAPLQNKLMGLLHMTGYSIHPLMLLILLLMLPIGLLAPQFMKLYAWAALASFGPPALCLLAKTDQLPRLTDRLKVLPLTLLIGFGLSFNNTIAVMQGLFSRQVGTFVRTPKLNVSGNGKTWAGNQAYNIPLSRHVYWELLLGLYAVLVVIILTPRLGAAIIPWGLIYAAGYFYMAGLNIQQHHNGKRGLNTSLSTICSQ